MRAICAAGAVLASLTLAACGGSAAGSDTVAVKNVTLSLFAALEHDDYASACADYTSATRTLVEQAALKLQGVSTSDCVLALRAVERASGPSNYSQLGIPQFTRVAVSGNTATVAITVTAPHGLIAHSTFSVVRDGAGWKVDRASSLQFSPAT